MPAHRECLCTTIAGPTALPHHSQPSGSASQPLLALQEGLPTTTGLVGLHNHCRPTRKASTPLPAHQEGLRTTSAHRDGLRSTPIPLGGPPDHFWSTGRVF